MTSGPLILDLGSAPTGSGGAIWNLPHGGDIDANLVRLDPGQAIGAHINDDVDVLLVVHSGTGDLEIDGRTVPAVGETVRCSWCSPGIPTIPSMSTTT